MYEMGSWKYEMTKRLPDITHQVSVLKILSFPDMYSIKYIQCYISEKYPFMTSCNNDELVNHVLAHEEEYARTGNAVDFLEMMADFKNEFEW